MATAKPGQWSGSPTPERTYIDFSLEGWHRSPNKVAVVDINTREELTFRQLEDRVRSFAGSLQALGVQSRSKVQFYANNCLNALIAQQAVLFCNASLFLFKAYNKMKAFEYNMQTEDTEVELVITDAVNYDLVGSALSEGANCKVKNIIIVDGTPKQDINDQRVLFLHQLPKKEFIHPTDVRIREDVLIVSFTSGSTGRPKGVLHSHYSFLTGLCSTDNSPVRMNLETDRTLLLSSLCFISSLLGCCGVLAYASTLILGSHKIDADLPTFIVKYQITVFVMLEGPMRTLMENAHNFPHKKQLLSSLERVVVAGSIFPENLRKQIKAFFGDVPLMNIYAMTESAGIVSAFPPVPDFTMHVGFLAPHFEVKILNDKEQPVVVGELGEFLWRGPQMMLGYWKRDSSCDFTDDGFFRTGDLVTVDSTGHLTVVGRKAHFIICLDARVAPQEIEDVLLQHDAVSEAVVVATPHPIVKEAPTAMIVLNSNYKRTDTKKLTKELAEHVASKFCENKQLHGGVFIVETLVKTDTGKYARSEIMQQAKLLADVVN